MKLHWSPKSPYVRKVMVVAHETGLAPRLELVRSVAAMLRPNEQLMRDSYDFAAIIEFDDLDGLKSYLAHPSHESIGRHFTASAARSLAYDYTLVDAAAASQLID